MNSLGSFGFMLAILIIWGAVFYTPPEGREAKAYASAVSFVLYRNAVNVYALEHKTPGVIPYDALKLPKGLKQNSWKNSVVSVSDGTLRCYVFADLPPADFAAVQTLLWGSAAIGWNNKGRLYRNGSEITLPGFIPHGHVVSVISLD